MGIYDRDYSRAPAFTGNFAKPAARSITLWLVGINLLVFVVNRIVRGDQPPFSSFDFGSGDGEATYRQWVQIFLQWQMGPLMRWGYFSAATAVRGAQVWRLVTYPFLHLNGWHVLGNAAVLFTFGPMVEDHFGRRLRFIVFYVLCSLSAAGVYLLLWAMNILVNSPQTPLFSASAGVMGVLVAAAMVAPDAEVSLYYTSLPLGVLAAFGGVLALFALFSSGITVGSEGAHFGGAVTAFVLMRTKAWMKLAGPDKPAVTPRRRKQAAKDWSKDMNR